MPWWQPKSHADRQPLLALRGRIKARLRAYFLTEGFIEVECGILAVSPGNEAHLHAFETEPGRPTAAARPFTCTPRRNSPPRSCWRRARKGSSNSPASFATGNARRLHAPEFTMLEWYRAHAGYRRCDRRRPGAGAAGGEEAGRELTYLDRRCDPFAEAEWLTVGDAFRIHAGVEFLDTLSPEGAGDRDMLATRARRAGFAIADDDGWSDIFSKVLAARVEPSLGLERLTILYDYPRAEAALARPKPDDPRLAERFELYACGVELANGFGELTDPDEQRARFIAEMDEKERVYGTRYPLDEDFLTALAVMPPASGVALGFDRLVMLASGAPHIDHVLWTPLGPFIAAMSQRGWQKSGFPAVSRAP